MPGANWTRKDYQAVAEMVGHMGRRPDMVSGERYFDAEEFVIQVTIAKEFCNDNAKLDINGNRNFKPERFIDECYKQAGRVK